MKRNFLFYAVMLILGCFIWSPNIYSENNETNMNELKENAPKVFIDCWRCDRDYIRTEITYVNYVRDRKDADIHLLVTDQGTGSGGREYTLAFIGLKEFDGMENTLIYVSQKTDTRDEIREGMIDVIKKGLFPFIMKTPIAEHLSIQFKQKKMEPTAVKDNWDFWVFNVGIDGELGGESSQTTRELDLDLSANRVTPELKIQIGSSLDYEESKYDYEDYSITSISKSKNVRGLVVKSINKHWSAGGLLEASSSTYSNIKSLYSFSPAIEYNFFPYSQSTRRQLRFLYKIGFNAVNYIEETIYEKKSDKLYNESLTISLGIREPWGSISTSLEGSHFFHDLKMNRIRLNGYLSVRIFKGLAWNVRGRFERVHDQLSLPLGETSLDEILLKRKELATEYNYEISMGLNYTFGSVFSNVVNPRFGGSRQGRYR